MVSESYKFIVALCLNKKKLPESELVEQLKTELMTNPKVAHEENEYGKTLLDRAAFKRSVGFCRLLVEENPEAVYHSGLGGMLPFHWSCSFNNARRHKHSYFKWMLPTPNTSLG